MTSRAPAWTQALMWALCAAMAACVFLLGPAYLIGEAGDPSDVLAVSRGGLREALAAAHVLFVLAMMGAAMWPPARPLVGPASAVAAFLGLLEMLFAVAAVSLVEGAAFGLPHMTVTALGALLLLAAAGLNVEGVVERLRLPKTPVALIFVAAMVTALAAFGLIGALNNRYYARVDYTRTGRHSVPEPTRELLAGLEHDVRITTLCDVREPHHEILQRRVTDVLEEYARISDRVMVEHIDHLRELTAASRLKQRLAARRFGLADAAALETNSVIFECPQTGRVMIVHAGEMIERAGARAASSASIRPAAPDEPAAEPRFIGDGIFHEALAVVTSDQVANVYFVVGHGEKPEAVGAPPARSLLDRDYAQRKRDYEQVEQQLSTALFEQALRRRYFRLRRLDLDEVGPDGVPADCDVLVIAGPWNRTVADNWGRQVIGPDKTPFMKPFTRKHAGLIRRYLERGGRALVMVDPVGPEYRARILPLLALLRRYGVRVDTRQVIRDEIVMVQRPLDLREGTLGEEVEATQSSRVFFPRRARTDGEPDAEPGQYHPAVRALGRRPVAVVECAPVLTDEQPGIRHVDLLTTSDRAWTYPVGRVGEPEGRRRGSYTVAAAVEDATSGRPVMVVIGCSNLFIRPVLRFPGGTANARFGRRVLAWLAGSAGRPGVEPRPTSATYGHADAADIRAARFVAVLVIPSVVVLAGALVWLARRK